MLAVAFWQLRAKNIPPFSFSQSSVTQSAELVISGTEEGTMAGTFSKCRLFCPDYARRHKSKIEYQRNFRKVSDLDFELLKQLLPAEQAASVNGDDSICKNCFAMFKRDLQDFVKEQRRLSLSDAAVEEEQAMIEDVKEVISAANVSVTPLKLPSALKKDLRDEYVERKLTQATKDFSKKIGRRLSEVYHTTESPDLQNSCSSCSQWASNIRCAYVNSSSIQEKCRILTLLPSGLTKKKVMSLIPEVTTYLLDRSRKLKAENGVWAIADAYQGHPLNKNDVALALSYYTSDDKDCTRASPNAKDVVTLYSDGQKTLVAKRFLTMSVREMYKKMKTSHPEIKLGLTKFYALRPKWVMKRPVHEECVCIYCANFALCLAALSNAGGKDLSLEHVKKLCLCENPSEECLLLNCKSCPKKDGLTLESLSINEEDEVELAIWESGELIKKHLDGNAFLNEIRKWATKYIPHWIIRQAQRLAICVEKSQIKPRTAVLHFDFAENWSVVLPRAVQGFHWKNQMVSIFTCVATTQQKTYSFGVISDDIVHDTAHALFALSAIEEWLEENIPVFLELIYVSDGAASHFKNRFQLHEMAKRNEVTKWIFSATGHGKSACDGVGAVLKHQACLHNLRSSELETIGCAEDFFRVVAAKVPGIVLLKCDATCLKDYRNLKKKDWNAVSPVKGIQTCHLWVKVQNEDGSVNLAMEKYAKP